MNRFGPYEVVRELGRGAVASVLLAREPGGREVALKVLLARSPKAARRFTREAKALARLEHPGAVRALRVSSDDQGRPFVVLERVAGASLAERLQEEGPLPLEEAVRLALSLAETLSAVHAAELLHRDLKPANLLQTPSGALKLVDFGLARDTDPSTTWSVLSAEGQMLGTPAYWAPEQAHGDSEGQGPWTDVFGLGGVLHALVCGVAPCPGNLAQALAALEEPPRPPSALRPQVDRALDAIVLRCLARDPQQRYPSAEAAARDLRRWLRARAPQRGRRRSLALPALAGLALAGLLALAAARVGDRPAQPGPDAPPAAPPPAPAAGPPEWFAAGAAALEDGDLEAAEDPLRRAAEAGHAQAMGLLGLVLDTRDPAAAVRWWRRGAEAGDPLAAHNLSVSYLEGEVVPRDAVASLRWARLAAEGERPESWHNLGDKLLRGIGCEPSPREAEVWLLLAAEAGLPRSMNTLAALYLRGAPGYPAQVDEGLRWLQRAAEAGDTQALLNLGNFYDDGQPVPPDPLLAERYYRRAAEQGSPRAQHRLGLLLLLEADGDGERLRDGVRWLRVAAEGGSGQAVLDLGVAYQKGLGVERDLPRAARLFAQAADAGVLMGAHYMGRAHTYGEGVEQSNRLAARWYERAAEAGHLESMASLARLLEAGVGVETDLRAAFRWRLEAARRGHAQSMADLAIAYAEGRGVAYDEEQCLRWLRAAANAGEPRALAQLGVFHEEGSAVRQDLELAARFYRQAIAAGEATLAPARLRALLEAHPELARTGSGG